MPTTHFVNFAATIIFYLYLLIPENYEEFDYDLPRTGSVCQHERSKTRCYEPCGSSADETGSYGFSKCVKRKKFGNISSQYH